MNELPLTREAILDAAEQTLRRFGPDKASVVDVARALQVSHGTLYRHFPSKASLREAVTERWLDRISAPLADIAGQSFGSSEEHLRTWLLALIASKRNSAADDPEMFAMYTAVTLDAVDMITEHVNHLIAQLERILQEGMRLQQFEQGSADALAKAVFMATARFHHPAHAYEWSAETLQEEFDTVWELLRRGLGKSIPSRP